MSALRKSAAAAREVPALYAHPALLFIPSHEMPLNTGDPKAHDRATRL